MRAMQELNTLKAESKAATTDNGLHSNALHDDGLHDDEPIGPLPPSDLSTDDGPFHPNGVISRYIGTIIHSLTPHGEINDPARRALRQLYSITFPCTH